MHLTVGRTHPAPPRRSRVLFVASCLILTISSCRWPGVTLPSNAPLSREDCGWPAATELAFGGWSTLEKLSFGDPTEVPGNAEQVFALVTADPIASGTADQRRYCLKSIDGAVQQGAVASDWQPPSDPAP